MATILLSDLVDEYAATLRSNAYSRQTVANHVGGARKLLTFLGNIYVHNITPRHIDDFFAARKAAGLEAASLNHERSALRSLFQHAARRRYLRGGEDPMAHRRPFREMRRNRVRVPAHDFGRLLDHADHPRDRIVVALGLYLFLRKSEVKLLRIGDVNLGASEVHVEVPKSSLSDDMPICAELDAELRRWMTWYSATLERPLSRDDFLVPAMTAPAFIGQTAQAEQQLIPSRPVYRPELSVQRVLEKFGVALRDEDGRSNREGVHTLRRSGARALFDAKVDEGYDGAIRLVQAMLHHSSQVTTERYLGIELDKRRRDTEIKGNAMFPVNNENVIRMEGRIRGEAEVLQNSV